MKRRISAALVVAVCVVWIALAGPVLFKFNPDPGLIRPRSYCITNPFRNRAPERAAEAYLEKLRAQDAQVLSALDPPYNDRERRYPIRSWRIGDRTDSGSDVSVLYWVRRGGNYFEGEEEVTVYLSARNGTWLVTEFNAIY